MIPKHIRIGHRARSKKLLATALPLLLIALSWATIIAVGFVAGPKFDQYKPVWWLTSDLRNDGQQAGLSVNEFSSRLRSGRITAADIAPAINYALDRQADLKKTWNPALGDLIESAHAYSALTDAQWKRYFNQMIEKADIEIRPEIYQHDPIPARVTLIARMGRNSHFLKLHAETAVSPSAPADSKPGSDSGGMYTSLRNATQTEEIECGPRDWKDTGSDYVYVSVLDAVPSGKATLNTLVVVRVADKWFHDDLNAIATFTARKSVNINVVSRRSVDPYFDPQIKSRLEKSIKLALFRQSYDSVVLYYRIDDTVGDLGFRIFVRPAGNKSSTLGIASWRGQTDCGGGFGVGQFPSAAKLDIILRPDPQVAASTMKLRRYWDHEIVYPDVPIEPEPKGNFWLHVISRPTSQPSR